MFRKQHFIFLMLMLWIVHTSIAQSRFPEYRISRLTPDDGLSQGSNYFRFEDSRGYMWITANDALNRYDGSQVKVYNLSRYFRNCPPLQQGYGFAEDTEGNLYIGSVLGLYIYHRNTDKFTLHSIFTDSKEQLAMPFAFKDGYVWCFNRQYELATYRASDGSVQQKTRIPLMTLPSIHAYHNNFLSIYNSWPFCDIQGNLWFVGRTHIYVVQHSTLSVREVHPAGKHEFLSASYDRASHQLLLGTTNGFLTYDISSGSTEHTRSFGTTALGNVYSVFANDRIRAVVSNEEDLLLQDRYSGQSRDLTRKSRKRNTIYTLSADRSGRIWLCDDGFGQMIYSFKPILLAKAPSELDTFSGLREKGLGQFAEMANGDIIVQQGVLMDHATHRLKVHQLPTVPERLLLSTVATDPYRKGVWMVFFHLNENYLYFTGADFKLQKILGASRVNGTGRSHHIKPMPYGSLLLSFSEGLYWLKGKTIRSVAVQPDAKPFAISPLSRNRYAISYLNSDMWLTSLHSKDSLQFLQRILPGVQSFYVAEDTVRNRYWVATNKGVYLLDANFSILNIFDANNGLAGTYIYGLLLDNAATIWCSHQRGLSSIDAADFRIVNYDKSDGIQDWDFNNQSFYKATDGTLYFGGVSGFNYFKPPVRPVEFYTPEVYIDEIMVNNSFWLPDTNANQICSLYLNYHQNNISIHALVKDLEYGKSRQLVYRIREKDTVWKRSPGTSMIAFNNLAPDVYTLELGILDKYSDRVTAQKKLLICIALPYYLKPWFWVLLTALFSLLCFYVYTAIRRNRQQVYARQQQALAQQRAVITADLHDELGSALSSLQINSEMAALLLNEQPGKVWRMLKKIAGQSRELSDKVGDIIWSMKPGKEAFMTLSDRIRNFAHDILEDIPIQYQLIIDQEVNDLITDIAQRRNLLLITKEAINNAVKYSQATRLTISMLIRKGQIVLLIADNGVGFDLSGKHRGNGLLNIKKRAEEIHGSLVLKSKPGHGTSLQLMFRPK